MTDKERQKLRNENKCYYCKAEGHKATECPATARTAAQAKTIDGGSHIEKG
jgi:hypothetical protein